MEGRKHKKDERTARWGSALMTFSTKRDGALTVQATCHRKHSHAPLPGKESTVCRQTYTVTAEHSEEQCVQMLKTWIGNAHNFPNRTRHQRKKYGLDEVPDDVEALKPPSDYDSAPEDRAVAVRARRPRMRVRRKCADPAAPIDG